MDYDKFMKELNRWCFWGFFGFCLTFFGSLAVPIVLQLLVCWASMSMQAQPQELPAIRQQVDMPAQDYNSALSAKPVRPYMPDRPCGRDRLPSAEELHNRRTVVVEELNF